MDKKTIILITLFFAAITFGMLIFAYLRHQEISGLAISFNFLLI